VNLAGPVETVLWWLIVQVDQVLRSAVATAPVQEVLESAMVRLIVPISALATKHTSLFTQATSVPRLSVLVLYWGVKSMSAQERGTVVKILTPKSRSVHALLLALAVTGIPTV